MIGLFVGLKRRGRAGSGPPGQTDTMPPVLAGLAADPVAQTFTFQTNEAGTLNWALDTTPAYATLAGLVAASGAATLSGSQAVAGGSVTVDLDLSAVPEGAWRLHVGVTDAAGNPSAVSSTDLVIAAGELVLNGDPLVWNTDQLIFNAA